MRLSVSSKISTQNSGNLKILVLYMNLGQLCFSCIIIAIYSEMESISSKIKALRGPFLL